MNVTKFLALKIAEAALAVSEDAEHIADQHSNEMDSPCYLSLRESGGKLALIMMLAAQNGVVPHGTFEQGEALKAKFREDLALEVIADVNAGRLELDRPLLVG